jgi:hypothetical protein
VKYDWLAGLFSELRSHGFAVGVAEANRVQQLLLTLHAADAFPASADTLSNMLSSILSTTEEQQRIFRHVFQNHSASLFESPRLDEAQKIFVDGRDDVEASGSPRSAADVEHAASIDARRFYRRVAVATLVAFVLLAILPRIVTRGMRTVSPDVTDATNRSRDTTPNGQGPAPSNSSSNTAGDTAIRMRRGLPTAFPAWSARLRQMIGGTEALVAASLIVATFCPFALLAWWVASPSRRKDVFINRRKAEGKPELFELLVSASTHNPFHDTSLMRHIQELRRPRSLPSDDLDVELTILETIKGAGMFTPVFARRRVASEYLILVDRKSKDDHVARYAEGLVAVLRMSQVYCDVYYFDGDFRRVFRNPHMPRLSLEELIGRHASHRLILITNGNAVLDPVSARVESWAFQIAQFHRRVCLTPTPPELWGYREMLIAGAFNCVVLPLLPESIRVAVEVLSDEGLVRQVPDIPMPADQREAMNRLVDILEDRSGLWLSSTKPEASLLTAVEEAARSAFGGDGYLWMAACAVYPELNWNLTLHLGSVLRGANGEPIFNAQRLLKLAILPWFRDGSMPTWLRRRLTASMSASQFEETQAALSKLLLSVFDFTRKTSTLNVAVEDRRPTSGPVRETAALSDTLLADFMARAAPERTRFRIPAPVARYLQMRRMSWARGEPKQDPSLQEVRANARALHATVSAAQVERVSAKRGPDAQFGEHAGFRPVVSFLDGDNKKIGVRDAYFLYWPSDQTVARLLDVDTAMFLLQRSRVVARTSMVNLVLMVVAAFYFSDKIFASYDNDAVSIGVVCMWMVIPYLLTRFMVLHRLNLTLEEFPAFIPIGTVIHKATQFKLKSDS